MKRRRDGTESEIVPGKTMLSVPNCPISEVVRTPLPGRESFALEHFHETQSSILVIFKEQAAAVQASG